MSSTTPGPDHAAPTKTTAAKAYVGAAIAIVGSGVTTAVALVTVGSGWFIGLTIASAMLTTAGTFAGVYATTNEPKE
jgi:hypothetical protein